MPPLLVYLMLLDRSCSRQKTNHFSSVRICHGMKSPDSDEGNSKLRDLLMKDRAYFLTACFTRTYRSCLSNTRSEEMLSSLWKVSTISAYCSIRNSSSFSRKASLS